MKVCQESATCHEAAETDTEKIQPDPRMMKSIAEHQEVPKEDTTMMPVGRLKKRRRDKKLAMGRARSRREGSRQVVNPGGD
jgi:putative hemolysin